MAGLARLRRGARKLTDDHMSKLTRMFIDAAAEKIEALPRGLPSSACATRRSGRRSSSPSCARCTTGHRPGRAWRRSTRCRCPRGVPADLRDNHQRLPTRVLRNKAIADARLGRCGPLPGVQRLEAWRSPYRAFRSTSSGSPQNRWHRARKESLRVGATALSCRTQIQRARGVPRRPDRDRFRAQGLDDLMTFNRLVIAMIVAGGLTDRA